MAWVSQGSLRGPQGPQGPPGSGGGGGGASPFIALTQAAYDTLNPPSLSTLYVIMETAPVGIHESGAFVALTQAQYNALPTPNPSTLYVIVADPPP